jgi:amidophosphoribosyltransferase
MCGIVGIYNHKDAAKLAYLSLYALQHRGEESAGIVSRCGNKLFNHKGLGLVGDIFNKDILKGLKGSIAVGHVRYSTTGSTTTRNIQPFYIKHKKKHLAIAHNGNLINTAQLHKHLEKHGAIFQSTMDSEVIAHLFTHSNEKNYKELVENVLGQLQGAYSLVMLLNDTLIGARDPFGWRPLCIGKLDESYVIASETCALDLIQAEYIRDVEPGEIVFITKKGIESIMPKQKHKKSFCIFEYIYFARPDSNVFGYNVYLTRKQLGKELAKESPVDCDLVMSIPDSGSYAAVGYAEALKKPCEVGMIRNHYVGRTFIQPSQFIRDFKVKVKLNPIKDVLKGKRIVVIEDSIVRGTTSKARIKALRDAGAKEIHMRVTCPPLKYPCFFGIDFPTKKELIASNQSVKQIAKYLGLDSLEYLSIEGMLKSMTQAGNDFCTACFSGDYPVKLPKKLSKYTLEK